MFPRFIFTGDFESKHGLRLRTRMKLERKKMLEEKRIIKKRFLIKIHEWVRK